eukprot:g58945.t1
MLFAVAGILLCHEHYSISAKRKVLMTSLGVPVWRCSANLKVAASDFGWRSCRLFRGSLHSIEGHQFAKKKQATVIEMYLVKHHPSLRGSRERSALCVCWMEWQGSYTSFLSTKYAPFPSIFTQNALGYTVGRELRKKWIMGSLGPLQMHLSHQGLNANGKRVFVTYEFEW